jgi:opacity protein-like surface antigen
MFRFSCVTAMALLCLARFQAANADENLFGYVKGAEPLPKGARELYLNSTLRSDKGEGHYSALDLGVEYEYGVTDKLAAALELRGAGIDTSGLIIDGYLPKDEKFGLRWSGLEASLKYNFLSAARDDLGVSLFTALTYLAIDPNSGQDKKEWSLEEKLLLQKYFLDGQMIWVGNVHFEGTRAVRAPIDDLPNGFDWPTEPEMEIEIGAGSGLSYRFASNWFVGVEALYVQENETEVGLERWSLQAGPNIHYGSAKWWATLTWLPQIRGGGETYPGQTYDNYHLVEKTRYETRLKFGINF